MEEDDNKLTTPLLHDDDGEEVTSSGIADNNDGLLNIDTSSGVVDAPSRSSSPTKSVSPRFYDSQSQWPASLTNKRRASYLDKLILNRQVATKNLLSELSLQDTNLDNTIAEEGIIDDDKKKRSQENDSEFVNKLQDFIKNNVAGGAATLRDHIPSMEIRLVDLTYKVPSSNEKWGKNKIPTLYNMSPIYMMKKLIQRMTNKDNRTTTTEQGGNTLTTSVLTNVNLCLKPGKMVCSLDVYGITMNGYHVLTFLHI